MDKCTGVAMPCEGGCIRVGYGFVGTQVVTHFFDYASAFMSGTVFPDLSIAKGKYGPNESLS